VTSTQTMITLQTRQRPTSQRACRGTRSQHR
jgi:hypothetical protein